MRRRKPYGFYEANFIKRQSSGFCQSRFHHAVVVVAVVAVVVVVAVVAVIAVAALEAVTGALGIKGHAETETPAGAARALL